MGPCWVPSVCCCLFHRLLELLVGPCWVLLFGCHCLSHRLQEPLAGLCRALLAVSHPAVQLAAAPHRVG